MKTKKKLSVLKALGRLMRENKPLAQTFLATMLNETFKSGLKREPDEDKRRVRKWIEVQLAKVKE